MPKGLSESEFDVCVARTETRRCRINVRAVSAREARLKALDMDGAIDFHDGSASEPEYAVEEVSKLGQ
jgi:hypothetical protein